MNKFWKPYFGAKPRTPYEDQSECNETWRELLPLCLLMLMVDARLQSRRSCLLLTPLSIPRRIDFPWKLSDVERLLALWCQHSFICLFLYLHHLWHAPLLHVCIFCFLFSFPPIYFSIFLLICPPPVWYTCFPAPPLNLSSTLQCLLLAPWRCNIGWDQLTTIICLLLWIEQK